MDLAARVFAILYFLGPVVVLALIAWRNSRSVRPWTGTDESRDDFLARLRGELSPAVKDRLIDTVDRDYAGADTDELEGRLTIAQLH